MHPAVQAVFTEHAKPTHASKGDVSAQLAPILKVAAAIRKQLIEYKSLLEQAELADDSVAGTLEHIRGTIKGAESQVNALVESARMLAKAFSELDPYMADQHAKLSAPIVGSKADGNQAAE